MKKKVLLTGAAGFAGSHIVEGILKSTDWEILALDRLSYAGRLERLSHLPQDRITFLYHDFRSSFPDWLLKKLDGVNYVLHNGAETHVENSLHEPEIFVQSNVLGTFHILEAARKLEPEKFVYVSTDEVYGPAPAGVSFLEGDPIRPSNPYAASKAGGEALVYSYGVAFKMPIIISRTMNLFGERQHPEKFIPMTLKKILKGELVYIHSSSSGQSGTRKWLHARNQADALIFLLEHGCIKQLYNIAGEERSNLDVAEDISKIVQKPLNHAKLDVHSTRPGHDLRYSIDDSKLRSLGWAPHLTFYESIRKTILWTLEHPEWLE